MDDNENPEFNEDVTFTFKEDAKEIKLSLFDSNLLSDSLFGSLDVDLSELLANNA